MRRNLFTLVYLCLRRITWVLRAARTMCVGWLIGQVFLPVRKALPSISPARPVSQSLIIDRIK